MTTIEIKRPNGEVETVDVTSKFSLGLNDIVFAKVVEATRNAGKGECLSYDNHRQAKTYRKPHASDVCPRCGTRCYGDCQA